jgi:mannosyltransferase
MSIGALPAIRLPRPTTTAAGLGALVVAGASLRFWAIAHQGLWYDESVTAWLVRGSPSQILATVPRTESTPPLYYLIAWAWTRLFGDSEWGLRSLSAIAGAATVPVTFAAARALATRRVGLAAAALVAVNPLLVWYSQEARVYSLFVLASAVSLWLLARVRARPTAVRLAAWSAAAAVALCVHYFAVFVVVPEAIWLLADRRARLRLRLAAAALPAVAALGQIGLIESQRGHASWLRAVPLRTRALEVPRQLLVGFGPPAGAMALAVATAAVVAAAVLVLLHRHGAEGRAAAVAATVVIFAVAAPVLLAVGGVDYLDTRNVICASVPLAVAVGAGLGARRAGPAGAVALSALVAVSVAMVAGVVSDPRAQRPPWRAVAAALAAVRGPHAILLDGSSTWARPLSFYLPRTWWAPRSGVRVRELEVLRRLPSRGTCQGRTWWGATCDLGSRPPLPRPPAGMRAAGRMRVAGFEIDRYRAARPVRLYRLRPIDSPGTRRSDRGRRRKLLTTPVGAAAARP